MRVGRRKNDLEVATNSQADSGHLGGTGACWGSSVPGLPLETMLLTEGTGGLKGTMRIVFRTAVSVSGVQFLSVSSPK